MTVVDAHHHLWDPGTRDYPWMAGPALAPIRRPFTLDDLRREATAAGVRATSMYIDYFLVAGVVGWVDLTADDVAGTLDRLRAAPGSDRLVGVRHQVQDEDDPAWLARADVGRGLRAVAAAGLAYDLLVLVPQLPAARAVVAGLPDARFVLDHAAKPAIAEGALEPWAGELAALARLPNVACKLSGLVTEARWDDWDADRIRPYADHVLTVFGPDRVMFGSDWPVCRLAASYGEVRELAEDLLAGLSPAERDAVFRRTAAGTYRLAP